MLYGTQRLNVLEVFVRSRPERQELEVDIFPQNGWLKPASSEPRSAKFSAHPEVEDVANALNGMEDELANEVRVAW